MPRPRRHAKSPVFTADDLTGAADVGTALLRAGVQVRVVTASGFFSGRFRTTRGAAGVDAVSLDCRYDQPASIRRKMAQAIEHLPGETRRTWYHKLDSTLRGRVREQIAALMRGLDVPLAALAAANPAEARVTVRGVQYVRGRPLARSPLVRETDAAPHRSRISDLLSGIRGVRLREVHLPDIRKGPAHLRRLIAEPPQRPTLLIFDAETNDDLRRIANGLAAVSLVFGAGALARYLAGPWDLPRDAAAHATPIRLPRQGSPVLIVSGSAAPASRRQLARLTGRREEGITLVERSAYPDTRRFLARVRELFPSTDRMIVAGGRTAEDVCAICGVRAVRLLKAVNGAISVGVTTGRRKVLLVLKPGGFGPDDLYRRSIRAMNRLILRGAASR